MASTSKTDSKGTTNSRGNSLGGEVVTEHRVKGKAEAATLTPGDRNRAAIVPPPSESYVYQSLETLTTIRILRLEPGEGDEPLHGQILFTDLNNSEPRDEGGHGLLQDLRDTFCAFGAQDLQSRESRRKPWIPFEAISYVWGDQIYTQTISTPHGEISITTNLGQALRQTRHSDQPRNLWADAVCINQTDIREKGHQAKNMGRVYSSAEGVLIWLGLDVDNKAARTFSLFFRCYHGRRWKNSIRAELEEIQWFERIWVVQELICANSRAIYSLLRI
ncbi:heterokaryon incompatibility protein-domain-containing protein [Boeremia exigua]|uniref:heterokaryon incompatibility protein-domain-containing protein n=1 Tax=Boeremia exigua TaxID=749465 RepID=UPI001E8E348E|nr:heterokaryon incompatibility protein-domain-containing protein [Boeremia exigua]KAH6615375.1 heterokaryon incompatibility protein-domain-containing protein [Boeremia exigua]